MSTVEQWRESLLARHSKLARHEDALLWAESHVWLLRSPFNANFEVNIAQTASDQVHVIVADLVEWEDAVPQPFLETLLVALMSGEVHVAKPHGGRENYWVIASTDWYFSVHTGERKRGAESLTSDLSYVVSSR